MVMIKIKTLFKKDPSDLGRVINEVDPENNWVFEDRVVPTRKWDGTAMAVIGGFPYKRLDVRFDQNPPEGAIACQDPDPISGHWPHWVVIDQEKPEDAYIVRAIYNHCVCNKYKLKDGTYEVIGPKINSNRENMTYHQLQFHGAWILNNFKEVNFEYIRSYLSIHDFEGIVFHHPDGRMCKIRKRDFGITR